MTRPFALLIAGVLSAGTAAAAVAVAGPQTLQERAAERLETQLRDRVPGKPQTCLGGTARLRDESRTFITARDRATVVFGRGGTVWRSDLTDCGGLREGMTLVTRTPTTSLCDGDIVSLVDLQIGNGFMGSCTWGEFVPYTRDRDARPR